MFRNRQYILKEISKPPSLLIYTISKYNKYISKFILLNSDIDTINYINMSSNHTPSICYLLARPFMTLFYYGSDINAIFNEGQMFVMSTPQLCKILRIDEKYQFKNILDIGAGDGSVCKHFLPLCNNITATEASTVLVNKLKSYGINALHMFSIPDTLRNFELYSCLNVLDRCSDPMNLYLSLEERIKSENSLLLLAIVFPYRPTGKKSRIPLNIRSDNCCFDDWIEAFGDFFVSRGLEIVTISRVPYLSQGNLIRPYYVLEDSIFLLKNKEI